MIPAQHLKISDLHAFKDQLKKLIETDNINGITAYESVKTRFEALLKINEFLLSSNLPKIVFNIDEKKLWELANSNKPNDSKNFIDLMGQLDSLPLMAFKSSSTTFAFILKNYPEDKKEEAIEACMKESCMESWINPKQTTWILENSSKNQKELIAKTLLKHSWDLCVEAFCTYSTITEAEIEPLILTLLNTLSDNDRANVISNQDCKGRNLFHIFNWCPEIFKVMVPCLSKDKIKSTLLTLSNDPRAPNPNGQSKTLGKLALHSAVVLNEKDFQAFMLSIPEKERPEYILKQDFYGNNLIHATARTSLPNLLFTLNQAFPDKLLVGEAFATHPELKYILHAATLNPSSLHLVLSHYPKEKRLQALLERNQNGHSAIELAFNGYTLVEIIKRLKISKYDAMNVFLKEDIAEIFLLHLNHQEQIAALFSKDHNGALILGKMIVLKLIKSCLTLDQKNLDMYPITILEKLTDEQKRQLFLSVDKKQRIFINSDFMRELLSSDEQNLIVQVYSKLIELIQYVPEKYRIEVFCKILLQEQETKLFGFRFLLDMPKLLSMVIGNKPLKMSIQHIQSGRDLLLELSKDIPDLKVPLAARQLLTLQEQCQKAESDFYQRLAKYNPGERANHIAEDVSLMVSANNWFYHKIKPHFEKEFREYGPKGKYEVKGKSEIEAIEIQIRKTILNQIQKTADPNVKKYIAEHEVLLCEGDPKTLDEARKYFNSNDQVAHLAWRCYDKGAATQGHFGNFFVSPIDRESTALYASTESLIGTGKKDLTKGNASDIIRERAAYYFLVAIDDKEPNVQDRITDFISYVAENRRAYNSNNTDIDFPNCFPGHLTKLANIGTKHSVAKIPPGAKHIIFNVMNDIIIQTFRARLKVLKASANLKKVSKTRDATLLYNALIYLSEANASKIARGETNEVVMLAEPYNSSLLAIRDGFRLMLPKDQIIISLINKKLMIELGRNLQDEELVYLQYGFENLGGRGLAVELTHEYQTIFKNDLPNSLSATAATATTTAITAASSASAATSASTADSGATVASTPSAVSIAIEANLTNPFPLTDLTQISHLPMPEAFKSLRLEKAWRKYNLFNACFKEKTSLKESEEFIHTFVRELVEEVYASTEIEPAKKYNDALGILKIRAEHPETKNLKMLSLIAHFLQKEVSENLIQFMKKIPPYKSPFTPAANAAAPTSATTAASAVANNTAAARLNSHSNLGSTRDMKEREEKHHPWH